MQQLKIDNEVINHLLFHKSLIDEKDANDRINNYVSMLQRSEEGEHISIENPFDRSIAIAFELVMQQHLDPWDIDLVNFSTLYLNRAKQEKIDLLTAGRIIYLAWKVLKLQSDNLVISVESQEEKYEPFGWGDIPADAYLTNNDPYSYTNLVVNMTEPPLDEPIRRDAKRKVTLIELLDAFNLARKESEEHILLEKQRQEERERLAERARKRLKGTTVEDHLEEDVVDVWKRIKDFPNKTMSLMDICKREDKEELIKVLVSILFLNYDNKVAVYQKKFPFGKIFIKNLRYR